MKAESSVTKANTPVKKAPSTSAFNANAVKRTKRSIDDESDEEDNSSNWHRPALEPFDHKTKTIAIMQLEADYYITEPSVRAQNQGLTGKPGSDEVIYDENGEVIDDTPATIVSESGQREAVIRLFGITEEGNSVAVHIHGFFAYFYVKAWPNMSDNGMKDFGYQLNEALKREKRLMDNPILKIRPIEGKSIWGYAHNQNSTFLEITIALPTLVASAARILEMGLKTEIGHQTFMTYETNVPFVLRYMVDNGLSGGAWLEIPKDTYSVRTKKQTSCQLEIDVDAKHIISHEPQGEWLKIAPLRVLSFDIECAGRQGHFPTADQDPVIQIGTCVSLSTNVAKPIYKCVHTLNTCASIAGAEVISSMTESEMLLKWRQLFTEADADIIVGYNTTNFDFPYLVDRAKALKIDAFPYFGRVLDMPSRIRNTTFASRAIGKQENKEMNMEGRVQYDVLAALRREYKLSSYTLNAVCAEFLKQQKDEVHHSIITKLQEGTDETRRRLAEYCLRDSILPLRLMHKLMLLVNSVEMARVTGVPLSYLLTRGQSIKVVSQLLRKAKQHGMLIPVMKKTASDDKFEGATVLEPMRGYYADPIATLDFASLYPSIMMAHNLCYSSLISKTEASQMDPELYTLTPNGDYFVKSTLHRGLLPEILDELLKARKAARKAMAEATDPFVKAVLNGRQLALKISANSVYGFTGAQVGQLPCLAISSSVTAFGRVMIEHTRNTVEKVYCKENGYEHDCTVIYGDTDSVMIKFGPSDIRETMRLGQEAAALVSKEFTAPIKLEFEKVYWPYLLMNKKRYAGLYWTNPDKWDKIDTKGIETVRRDNCELVRTLVSEVLHDILVDRSPQKAIDRVKRYVSDLLCNRLDLSLLVISKSLGKGASSSDYAAKQAHVELAERLRKKDPTNAPVVGDRVPYVITRGPKDTPIYERSQDPLDVLENELPIDPDYYLEQQLKNPLMRIFEPILGSKAVGELFAGEHTRKIKTVTSTSLGIMKFAKKVETCIGCRVVLPSGRRLVCAKCEPRKGELYTEKIQQMREYESVFGQVWSQCQRCQGSVQQEILCTSRDCPIFYRRKKVQKDLNDAIATIDRFSQE